MEVSGRMTKWEVELSEYDIQYASRPAIKAQILTDFITEGVTLSDKSDGVWEVYVDGAASQHGVGAGVVRKMPAGAILKIAICFKILKTNNASKYEVLLAGLTAARHLSARAVRILSDSAIAVNQLNGIFDAEKDRLALYIEHVKAREAQFKIVTYIQIPREENMHADALSKLATATDFDATRMVSVQKEDQDTPHIVNTTQGEEGDWQTPIITFLINGAVPKDAKEAWALRQKAARCTLIDGTLHRRSHSGAYLKCVGPDEAQLIVRDIHEGICVMHCGARSMERTILLQGYYWP
ncbi:unnamed protein product [Linum trigynum]|uniref:RNase H type-1 domain-containing protein n=1 Tax=Linum trigynum TaxID=586398 RepID=A0AAV2DBY7_9ROSI